MARRYVGTVHWRAMIALCAIVLLAPQAYGQITIKRKTYTISGTIGLSGVSLQGLPGTPVTDENGVYSVEVESTWTGKVKPVKIGYEFQPAERSYTTKITASMPDQDYTATLLTYTITGTAGQPGVRMGGFPTEVVSGPDGRYTATVDYGWSGIITPDKMGFRFEPPTRSYNQVIKNVPQDDYKAVEVTFTISGSAGVPGIKMEGLPGNPVTDQNGRYSVEVRYGTRFKVTPTKDGHLFTPEYREYEMVVEPQLNQDYDVRILSYDISGSTGMPGVVMKGFPQDIVTDENGFYSVTVNYGFSGKVTPEKPGYTFVPDSRQYQKVTESFANHDYSGSVIYLKIEGTTGLGSVEISGFPQGVVTTDEKGFFRTQVEYGWTGVITPQKEGYFFTPQERPFNAITADQPNQNFKAEKVYFEISGNVSQPGVQLRVTGVPGSVTSKADGTYSFKVDYNWEGTVTPTKPGFTFDPTEQRYMGVLAPQTNQDYVARIVQHTISGKVVDKKGTPVPEVLIVPDNQAESVTTDFDGVFELKVDHGWKGKIAPQKDGWIFTPTVKPFDMMVTQPIANQLITGEIKMLTISDVIMAVGNEPVQGVKVTAEPGGYEAVTDAKGRWTLRVPYGWTGSLSFTHPDFIIEGTKEYVNVTEDIDETAPKKPPTRPQGTQPQGTQPQGTQPQGTRPQGTQPQGTQPQGTRPQGTQPQGTQPQGTQPQGTQPQGTQPQGTQPQGTQPQGTEPQGTEPQGPISPGKEALLRRIEEVKRQLDPLLTRTGALSAADLAQMNLLIQELNKLNALLVTGGELSPEGPGAYIRPTDLGNLVTGNATPRLHSVLAKLSQLSSTPIAVDLTVKDEPVVAGAESVQGMPLELALAQILEGLSKTYTFRRQPDGTYLVYHPISNTFPPGSDLLMALSDIATEADVSIMTDPNVAGVTSANFVDQPLEGALKMVLAGTPFVFRGIDNYYVVADRSPEGPAFPDISDTEIIRLNHSTPLRVKELLLPTYQRYVQAEAASTVDPNDLGHTLTITAPAGLRKQIVDQIRKLDKFRRQVLLDARVVAMERGNLLNLGVEWQFPTMQYGGFKDDTTGWLTGLTLGYSPDQTFTNALMAKLNLLESTSQADIVANPQLTAQDNSQAQLRSIQEEWFMMSERQTGTSDFGLGFSRAELQKIESGTVLTITPRVGDSNEITLEMAIEVSDSIPRGADSDLPIVTRRQTKNKVTVLNGGTVAVAGLTENRTRQMDKRVPVLGSLPIIGRAFRNNDDQKATREIAVFVTATLIPEMSPTAANNPRLGIGIGNPALGNQPQPAGQEFTDQIRERLNSQPR